MSSLSLASDSGSVGVIACGALATHIEEIAQRRAWAIDVFPLPPLLHNHPARIADEVSAKITQLRPQYGDRLAIAYADCGTYGALDDVCAREGLQRLGGNHCYDIFAGTREMAVILEEQPGTYFLTDFLVRSFHRSVVVELGLDRYPELRDDYFKNYTRVVWLAQRPTAKLLEAAKAAAVSIGLPLEVSQTADSGLEQALATLLTPSPTTGDPPCQ